MVFCYGKENVNLEGKNFSSADFESISFENNQIQIHVWVNDCNKSWLPNGSYKYAIKTENDLCFLYIYNESKYYKYLIIYNDKILIMYDDDDSSPFFFGYTGGNKIEGIYWNIEEWEWFSSSSHLKENNIEYDASNLTKLKTKEPWVEGVEGYGIGEKIYITNFGSSFFIINGFISYKKPYLWNQNSRVKKLKMSFVSNPEYMPLEIELENTSLLQKIVIPPNYRGKNQDEKIEIEILEVYEGSKYQDTCINGIIVSCVD